MIIFWLWLISIAVALYVAKERNLSLAAAALLTLFMGPLGLLFFLWLFSDQHNPRRCGDENVDSIKEKISSIKSSIVSLQKNLEELERSVDALPKTESYKPWPTTPVQPPVAQQDVSPVVTSSSFQSQSGQHAKEAFEFVFGKYWLSRIGIFLFVAGIGFFANQAFSVLNAYGKIFLGYVIAGGLFYWGTRLERGDRYQRIGWGILGGAWGLLYLVTYAMHYIKLTRIIESPIVEFILLAAVSICAIVYGLRYRQWVITAMTYILAFFTAGLGGIDYLTVCYCTLLCSSIAYLSYKLDWHGFSLCAMSGVYLVYMYWLRDGMFPGLSNYVGSGNTMYKFQVSLAIVICAWLVFFIAGLLIKAKRTMEEDKNLYANLFVNSVFAVWLGLGEIGYFVGRLRIKWDLMFFYCAVLAIAYLVAAYLYNVKKERRFSSLSVCISFSLLAIAVAVSSSNMPITLFWLVELLLVYIVAVNYGDKSYRTVFGVLSVVCLCRLFFIDCFDASRYSVLGYSFKQNIFIFFWATIVYFILGILLMRPKALDVFSKFEQAFYRRAPLLLTVVFVFVLGGNIVERWLTLSWAVLGVAVLGAGFLSEYKKYRILGLATVVLALSRLFFVDLKGMDTMYRVVTFMLFGAILVGVSFAYSALSARK